MQVYLLTGNVELAQTITNIVECSDSSYQLSVHEGISTLRKKKKRAGVCIIDADLPMIAVMKILEQLDSELLWLPQAFLSPTEYSHKEVPGFEASRHLALTLGKEEFLRLISLEMSKPIQNSLACRVGELTFIKGSREVVFEDRALRFSKKEYDILEILATNEGKVVSKQNILDALYGKVGRPREKIVDVFICNIRSKIRKLTGGDCLIDTVRGCGYVLGDSYDRTQAKSSEERRVGRRSAKK